MKFGTPVVLGPGYDYVGEEFSGNKIAIKQQRNRSWRGAATQLNQNGNLAGLSKEEKKFGKRKPTSLNTFWEIQKN